MDKNQKFSVYIAESENCLRDWMDETTSVMSFHGLTFDEAVFLCQICRKQKSPHDAMMKIEAEE